MNACLVDPTPGEDEAEDARADTSRALRRLVGFVASALDVRFAFVVALGPPARPRRLALWLARDYGLRTELEEVEVHESLGEPASPDLGALLRRVWPHEPELAEAKPGGCVFLPLVDSDTRLAGYLGVLDPERVGRFCSHERLGPLARRAAAEVERWVGFDR